MSLVALRFVLWVGLATGVIAGLWLAVDAIGDAREARVRGAYDQAIDSANSDTVTANDAATKVALRDQRVRDQAVAAYKQSLGKACPLDADEAATLAKVR